VEDAFARSINNVFIRVMRDITRYYIAQDEGQKLLTADREDPNRNGYLRRFVDQDSRKYLNRFHREYRGLSPDQALELLAHRTRPIARRLAVIFRSVRPRPIERGSGRSWRATCRATPSATTISGIFIENTMSSGFRSKTAAIWLAFIRSNYGS
jgi:hypothetical protein